MPKFLGVCLPRISAKGMQEEMLSFGELLFFQRHVEETNEAGLSEWMASSVMVIERDGLQSALLSSDPVKNVRKIGGNRHMFLPLLRHARRLPQGVLTPFERQDALTLWGESQRRNEEPLAFACEWLVNACPSFPFLRLWHSLSNEGTVHTTAFFYLHNKSYLKAKAF